MPFLRSVILRSSVHSLLGILTPAPYREDVKMILVVRKDLKMGTGKIAAQCAHAAVAVVEEVLSLKSAYQPPPLTEAKKAKNEPLMQHPWIRWHETWRGSGSTKVVLQCPDEEVMRTVAEMAKRKMIPYYIIRDAGRTQVVPGSKTVVAVGPGPRNLIDQVTGDLKLL